MTARSGGCAPLEILFAVLVALIGGAVVGLIAPRIGGRPATVTLPSD